MDPLNYIQYGPIVNFHGWRQKKYKKEKQPLQIVASPVVGAVHLSQGNT